MVSKYSVGGNDFVIFHALSLMDRAVLARALCDRHHGIGADGMIVLVPHQDCDFEWDFYNCDGSHASMCGNGASAAFHYAVDKGLGSSSGLSLMSQAGPLKGRVNGKDVEVTFDYPLRQGESFEAKGHQWYPYHTGVPHLVTLMQERGDFSLELAGSLRQSHNANVNFATLEGSDLYVRTYERGVEAETQACGTGMAATFLVAHSLGLVGEEATVYPKSKVPVKIALRSGLLVVCTQVTPIFEALSLGTLLHCD